MAAASATNDWELGGEHQEDGGWSDGGPGEDEEGELDRLREENRQLREENHKLRQQKWSSKSYHKTVGSKKLDGAEVEWQVEVANKMPFWYYFNNCLNLSIKTNNLNILLIPAMVSTTRAARPNGLPFRPCSISK